MKKARPLPPIPPIPGVPLEERDMPYGKIIKMYRNGDRFFTGVNILVNENIYKTWDIFLDTIQEKTKTPNAIRNIYTPESGTPVSTFNQFQDDHKYVAATGKFIPLRYTSIESTNLRPSNQSKANLFNNIEPVKHSNIRQQSRYKEAQEKKVMRISVAINKHDLEGTRSILIPVEKTKGTLDQLMEFVDKEINTSKKGPILKVKYLAYKDGSKWRKVRDPEEIDTEKIFVACDNFSKLEEKEYPHEGRKNFITVTPRTKQTLPPISGGKGKKGTPDDVETSNPENKRPNQTNGTADNKAKKQKNTSGKRTARQVDNDRGEEVVFHADADAVQNETKGTKN